MGLRGRLPANARHSVGAVDIEVPPAPDYVSEQLASVWDDVWAFLASSGRGHAVDAGTVEAYVDALHIAERARIEHAEQGSPLTTTGSTGQLVEHPLLKLQREAARDATRYATALGLNPTGRARLGISAAPKRTLADFAADTIGPSPRRPSRLDDLVEPPLKRSVARSA